MIRHIVFFSAPSDKVDAVRNGLSILTEIPDALTFEIGTNIKRDLFGNEVDLVVYAEFETVAALDAFKSHPLYRAAVDIVRPIRELRIAADFDTSTATNTSMNERSPERGIGS